MIAYVLTACITFMDHKDVFLVVPSHEVFGGAVVNGYLHLLTPWVVNDIDWVEELVFDLNRLIFKPYLPVFYLITYTIRWTDDLDDRQDL